MDYLDKLNDKQYEAVHCIQGPLLILAGAGSGKTKTIISRIVHIIESTQTPPYQILALTFTNKAAAEMRNRINSFGIRNTEQMWMGTFHSICARILRTHASALGFTSNFSIYDEADKKNIITKCVEELGLGGKISDPQVFISIISNAKNNADSAEAYALKYAECGDFIYEKASLVYTRYQESLRESNSMDFDDLLLNVLILFNREQEILEHYQNRFKYILVDEYQDTNPLQYEIVSRVAEKYKNICVCGDDDQSIYGWRGADIRNILEFEEDFPNAKVIKLEQNYRSTSTILNAANKVIEQNTNRKGKNLWTEASEGDKIKIIAASKDIEEADMIAREIQKLHNMSTSYSDIAVLYRINSQSRMLEEGLIRRSIPYQIVGSTRFYERQEIKDILSYLKLTTNRFDKIAFARAVISPKRGLGPAALDKLVDYSEFKGYDIVTAALNAEDIPNFSVMQKGKMSAFAQIVDTVGTIAKEDSLSDAIKYVITESGYAEALKNSRDERKESRLQNLDELVNAAYDFENTSDDASLEAFLENAALIAGVDTMSEDGSQVLLMTMHNSKGLEFNTVFLPGFEEGIFPSSRSIGEQEQMEEERRLCYVGITRAREKLYISHAQYRRVFGRGEYKEPSRFLTEIPDEYKELSENLQAKVKTEFEKTNTKPRNISIPTFVEKEKSDKPSEVLGTGDKILHPNWGEGTVVSAEQVGTDVIVTAAFAGLGVKKL